MEETAAQYRSRLASSGGRASWAATRDRAARSGLPVFAKLYKNHGAERAEAWARGRYGERASELIGLWSRKVSGA